MKIKKASLILPLVLSFSLVGCGETTSQSNTSNSLTSDTTSDDITSSIEDSSTSEELSVNEICDGTAEGRLSDIEMKSFVTSNFEYACVFRTNSSNKQITFRVSNSDVIEIKESVSTDGRFTLVTKNAGDAILEIFDSNEMLVYRNIVRVRDSIGDTEQEISEYLFSVDKFSSIFTDFMLANYELTFLSPKTANEDPTGYLTGYDDFDTAGGEHNFHYHEDEEYRYDSSRDCYWFLIDVDSTTSTQTTLYSFSISRTGDKLMVYYLSGNEGRLLTIMAPDNLLYLYDF